MLDMNSRGNVMVARLLYPLLAFAFVFAARAGDARLHRRLRRGGARDPRLRDRHAADGDRDGEPGASAAPRPLHPLDDAVHAAALSVALSWSAALRFGLAGAAAGSVVAVYLDRIILLRHLARHTGVRRSAACSTGASSSPRLLSPPHRAPSRWAVVETFLHGAGALARLALGAAVFCAAYAATLSRWGSFIRNRQGRYMTTPQAYEDVRRADPERPAQMAGHRRRRLHRLAPGRAAARPRPERGRARQLRHRQAREPRARAARAWAKRAGRNSASSRATSARSTTCNAACAGVDLVLHQAALGSVPRSIDDPLRTHDSNVNGFLNMLVAARDAGVSRIVYASSSAVYGD